MASKSTKKDLVQHIAKALEVSPVEAERVMLVVMRYVRRQLLEDTSVILPGIGTLAVTETAARLGRNPHTGQPVPIPLPKPCARAGPILTPNSSAVPEHA